MIYIRLSGSVMAALISVDMAALISINMVLPTNLTDLELGPSHYPWMEATAARLAPRLIASSWRMRVPLTAWPYWCVKPR